jgi:hypothetical protein
MANGYNRGLLSMNPWHKKERERTGLSAILGEPAPITTQLPQVNQTSFSLGGPSITPVDQTSVTRTELPQVTELPPVQDRVNVAEHLNNVAKIQQNRNRWNARLAPFGGSVSFSDLGDINKMAGIVDKDIQAEISARLRQAILRGEITGVADIMRWYNEQGFDPYFAKATRESGTSIIDQLMQEQEHSSSQRGASQRDIKFLQDQQKLTQQRKEEEQANRLTGLSSGLVDEYRAEFFTNLDNINERNNLYNQVREAINTDHKDLSSTDRAKLFKNFKDSMEEELAFPTQADLIAAERWGEEKKDKLKASSEKDLKKLTTIESDKIVNAAVDEFNKLVDGGTSREKAERQILEKIREWATTPDYVTMQKQAGTWGVSNTRAAGTTTGVGQNIYDFNEGELQKAFQDTIGKKFKPKDQQYIDFQTERLSNLNPASINQAIALEMKDNSQKGGEHWYKLMRPVREGIAIDSVINYINLANPGAINRQAILREWEVSEAFENWIKYVAEAKKEKKGSKERIAKDAQAEAAVEEYISEKAKELNVTNELIQYIILPELYGINIGIK